MTTEGEKSRRWQFSLRGLLAAVLVVSVGLGLFVRWWTAPFVTRGYHDNGVLAREVWAWRDLRGERHYIRFTDYYSTGVKAANEDCISGVMHFWSPDGVPAAPDQAQKYLNLDNGDGAFREPRETLAERSLRLLQEAGLADRAARPPLAK